MLQRKFTITRRDGQQFSKERDAEAWKESLSMRWAVIRLKKDAVKSKDGLQIPRIEPSQRSNNGKSVKQLLEESRSRNETKVDSPTTP